MTTVLTETNVSELLKVSAGESEPLRRLTADFEKKVEEQFRELKLSEELKHRTERPQTRVSAAAG
jgi:hypothetical protein